MSDAEQTYHEVILSVPSAMYFECLILDYQLYDDHPDRKILTLDELFVDLLGVPQC